MDVIVDGTDNFATRFLINDFAVKRGKPWIYGGCIGAEGQSMTILPGETACLACLMADLPPPGTTPTCDTAGILAPIVNVVASIEAAEALKILSGNRAATSRRLTIVDLWDCQMRQVDLSQLRASGDCRRMQAARIPLACWRARRLFRGALWPKRRAAKSSRWGDTFPRRIRPSARRRR